MFLFVCPQNAYNGTKQSSFKQSLVKLSNIYNVLNYFFVNFDLRGIVTYCARTCKVRLFV